MRLAEMIERYEQIEERLGRAMSYAQLLHAANTDDPQIGRFFQTVQERVTEIGTKLLFVTLELNRIEDAGARGRSSPRRTGSPATGPGSATCAAFARTSSTTRSSGCCTRSRSPAAAPGSGCSTRPWRRCGFPRRQGADQRRDLRSALRTRTAPTREGAARAIADVLGRNVRLFALITNTLAKDKQIEDGWRKFARPISSRNLANQVEDEVVDALIAAVRAAYPRLSHRYYALKARWLGLERLEYWDRNAPLPEDSDKRVAWSDAKVIVLDAYRRLLADAWPRSSTASSRAAGSTPRCARARTPARSAIRPCRACIPMC